MEREETKLKVVKDYLQSEFPDCIIKENHDFDLEAQTFKIRKYPLFHLLKIDDNYLDDNDESNIVSNLQSWKVADFLRKAEKLPVFVGSKGPALLQKK